MPDVTVIIDGQTVSVPAGTNIVEAARKASSAVPVFCYHPKMKPVGMCRMCLVEVWTPKIDPATRQVVMGPDGQPVLALMMNKLQPGCVTPVSDGMVVKTDTDKVKFAQRGQLEFLLTSHPLDCPVCDKGGECPLQNLTMQFGPGQSRFEYTDKVHFQKPIPLGDLIYLDRERCILCSRCVRFQDEIAGDQVLGFDNRGRAWEIISKSDPPFDSKFSGNTTDICPVGALTSADFRFKARVWELRSAPSICPHCPVGCDVSLDMRHSNLMRVMPRENDFVNEIWLCDKGRFGMRFMESQERLTKPLIRRNGELAPATWDEAIQLVTDKLAQIHSAAGGTALAGMAGPKLANEDLYLFQRLLRETLGSNNLDHRAGLPGEPALDNLAATLGVGSGTNLMTLGKGTAVLVVGADPEEEAPLYVLRLRGIQSRGGDVTVVNNYPTKLGRSASRTLQPRPGTEAHLLVALLKVIAEENLANAEFTAARVRGLNDFNKALDGLNVAELVEIAGVAENTIRAAARAFANAENGIIIYGRTALAGGPALAGALANLALLTGKTGKANSGLIALLPGGNGRGAHDMGVRPDRTTSGTTLKSAGLSARETWKAAIEGQVRGMYIAALDPARESPEAAQALDALEFLVVQDLFLTETAKRADVVLPAAAFSERDGTFTNAERRVQRFRQARHPIADLPADWEIFQRVAQSLQPEPVAIPAPVVARPANGKARAAQPVTTMVAPPAPTWNYTVVADVSDEIAAKVPGYAGASHTALAQINRPFGRQSNEAFYYDGTSYDNPEGLGAQLPAAADDARATFAVSFQAPVAPVADTGYPLTLVVAPRLYDNGTWSQGSKLLPRMAPAHAILSVADANKLGVGIGERIKINSAAGTLELPVQIDTGLAAGQMVVPAVAGIGLGAVVTGTYTAISIAKVEG